MEHEDFYLEDESFRDSVSTIDKEGHRVWIYPFKPKGRYYNARNIVSTILLIIFFGMPFIKVNGHPFFMLNVLERRFILFGYIFWPQDSFLFVLAMITFMVFIILFTSVFGRLWCGWACPQTIFMEMVFRKIEYWIEGDSQEQKALKRAPWNGIKIRKKLSKYTLFYLISFLIANTFLAYIISFDELKKIVTEPFYLHVGGFFSILIFSGVFYFVFAYMREQVCLVVCPYGRLQGVLLDKNAMVVAYDHVRGESREKLKKGVERAGGDCIDCNHCVRVCPTGIDIRNGTQLECINCTACIDACDEVMDKVGFDRGLVRFASENSISKGEKFKITGKIIGYSIVLSVLVTGLGFAMANRSDVETTILRTPGIMFQKLENNKISNLYNINMVNKTFDEIPTTIKLEGISGEIKMIGGKDIILKKSSEGDGEFFVILDKSQIHDRKTEIRIAIYSGDKKLETIKTAFLGPVD